MTSSANSASGLAARATRPLPVGAGAAGGSRSGPASGDWVDALVAAHRPGWTLAQPFYHDPAIFRRDFERIFLKQWVFAGHVSRVRHAGDYFLFHIGGESLIVIRGQDGNVHALFNVCRHRGSRVCLEPAGSARALVCPYHAWTYGTDGRLLSAPAMPPDFDPAESGLRPCPVRVVAGLIFVCLGPEPPDRDVVFRDWERYFQAHRLPEAKIATNRVWRVNANWKLVIENFEECYHCGPAHPEYCSVMAHARPQTHGAKRDVEAWEQFLKTWSEDNRRRGHITGRVEHEQEPFFFSQCDRWPIRQGYRTQSQDGQPVAPLMGDFQDYDGGWTYASFYPVNYCFAFADHAVVPRFTPLAPRLTEVEMIWLVNPTAVEGRDYQLDRLTWLWRVTTDQDAKIVDDNQAGVNSLAYQPGPYSQTEPGLVRFTSWYLSQIATAAVAV
jgi:phenylpropionate dioxygenase-like ring-hydroxylating dioxygenase large terminal subunit